MWVKFKSSMKYEGGGREKKKTDNSYRIHVLIDVSIAWICLFTSSRFTSTEMGSFHAWASTFSVPGCDALGCALEALAFGSTAMCGRSTFWFWVIAAVPFYGATWENFFTNTLVLPVVNGPTEGLMLIYVAHFFTAFVGAHWWAQKFGASFPFLNWVPYFSGIPTSQAMLYLMTIFAVIPTLTFNIQNVHHVVKSRKGNMMLALAMLYPFVVLLLGVLAWDYLSPINLIGTYPHLVVAGTGLAFGFLVGRMILSHLCDEPKGLKTNMCMSLLYLPLAIANTLTARLNDGVPLVDEVLVLLGYCAFTALALSCFNGLPLSTCTSQHQSFTKSQQHWGSAVSESAYDKFGGVLSSGKQIGEVACDGYFKTWLREAGIVFSRCCRLPPILVFLQMLGVLPFPLLPMLSAATKYLSVILFDCEIVTTVAQLELDA
ncbi:hypothetical protein KSS87_018081 [Heliosperma pusillum]|nr:hypothetical protein KSS87_018081 [Heliosperma pusillum]